MVVLSLSLTAGCSNSSEGRDLVIQDYSDQISTLNEVARTGQRYVDGSLTDSEALEAVRGISTSALDGEASDAVSNLVIAIRTDNPELARGAVKSVERQIEVLKDVRQGFIELEE